MTQPTPGLEKHLTNIMPGEIEHEEVRGLFLPGEHPPLLKRHRAKMIVTRVRLFALLFAICTPIWIVADYFTFPTELFAGMATLRVLATIAFIGVVMRYRPTGSRRNAYQAMALMFLIPTLFYLVSHALIGRHEMTGTAAALASGYAFLPFVLLCGLAIFPLTFWENLWFSSPILLAHVISGLLLSETVDWAGFVSGLWLMALISGVTLLAGMSQLAFMVALVRQAIRDPLTGAMTRRSGEEILEMQLVIAYRARTALAIAFVDLDHFKSVNDSFGHDAGDALLKAVARAIRNSLRQGDSLIRWGGEEFLVVMPNAQLDSAEALLERLRDNGFGLRPDGERQTASVGLAGRVEDGLDDWHELVERADARMYRAKIEGRDRIISHDDYRAAA